ncbi:MAG: hypothetical protein LBU13_07640 [Synergistaceae bacterium]|nr:hypothetical protein [Synergistaceae bacterium]
MILDALKDKLYERVAMYWSGAAVVWSAADKVKPNAPLVVLRLGTVKRALQPITQAINGILFSAYPSDVTLQVDLFTRGKRSKSGYLANTALNDLLDFANFLNSTASTEWSSRNDISLALLSGVQDLSEVINDTQWQYRAMCEYTVSFTQWAAEFYGILNEDSIVFGDRGMPTGVIRENWQITASGGGTEELANERAETIEGVTPETRWN